MWRSLHSPAAQLEYVTILGRSLSEIVHCGLELKEALRKRNREISPLQREDRIRDELSAQIKKLVCIHQPKFFASTHCNCSNVLSLYFIMLLQYLCCL